MRIRLDIDTADAFDYELHGKPKYSVGKLRELLSQEIIQLKLDKDEKALLKTSANHVKAVMKVFDGMKIK